MSKKGKVKEVVLYILATIGVLLTILFVWLYFFDDTVYCEKEGQVLIDNQCLSCPKGYLIDLENKDCVLNLKTSSTDWIELNDKIVNSSKGLVKTIAQTFIKQAEVEFVSSKLNGNENTSHCYNIHSLSLNIQDVYVGSILTSDDTDTQIWLSDGQFMTTGTLNDLKIVESKSQATQTCNQ